MGNMAERVGQSLIKLLGEVLGGKVALNKPTKRLANAALSWAVLHLVAVNWEGSKVMEIAFVRVVDRFTRLHSVSGFAVATALRRTSRAACPVSQLNPQFAS